MERRYSICLRLEQFRQIVARKRFLAGDQIFKLCRKNEKDKKYFFHFFSTSNEDPHFTPLQTTSNMPFKPTATPINIFRSIAEI